MPCYRISATEKNGQPWRAYAECRSDEPLREWLTESGLAIESITRVAIWNHHLWLAILPKLVAIILLFGGFVLPTLIFGKGLIYYSRDYFLHGKGSFLGWSGCFLFTFTPLFVLSFVVRVVIVGLLGEQATDSARHVRYHNIQRTSHAPIPK